MPMDLLALLGLFETEYQPFAHPTSFNRTRSAIVVHSPGTKVKLPRAIDQPKSGLQCVFGGTFCSASWLEGTSGI
jgi:hypothetical protein